ncbi:MAG: glutamate 5-kinase [Sphingomonadaceae bacterium]|nr:glutamate 5-kinase [Sphingomonadaceae bacterium]
MKITCLSDLSDPVKCPSLVIKVGSSLLVDRDGVRAEWLSGLVAEIAAARARGQNVIVVCSGAIALGAAKLGLEKGGRGKLSDAQASAAVGQIVLSGLWAELLAGYGLVAAQMLITLEDLELRRRYLNATATLESLLDEGVVPVINENDCVATHEIRFGDNDRLAARVAQAARANAVLLLSDVDGLYDRDPADPDAELVREVHHITPEVKAMATSESASGMGSGGMTSKLQAAEIAEFAGIALAIINGIHERPITQALENDRGTLFVPRKRKAGARMVWLGGRLRLKGSIIVDDGAATALREGASLLAKGITGVEGSFKRGDAIAIMDSSRTKIAHGLSEYDASECFAIKGLHSKYLYEMLGYAPRSAVVHRDQLVLK